MSDSVTFTSSLIPNDILSVIIKIIYTDLWVLILEPFSPQAPLSKPGLPVQGPRSEIDPFTHPLSFPFHRNATRFTSMTWRQTTTDRIWGNAALPELLTIPEPVLLRLVNQTCLRGRFREAGGDRECVHVYVNTRVQACACLLHVLGHIICHRINQPFQFSSKISLYRSPLSPSVQTFYCINLLKHFRMFSRVIWERDSQQRNAVLLRLALPFANMPFIFIPTETLYARVGKYPACVVFFSVLRQNDIDVSDVAA